MLDDGKAIAMTFKRLVELAELHQRVADPAVRYPQIPLPLCICGIAGCEPLDHVQGLLMYFERLLQIAKGQIGLAEFIQHHRTASLQARIVARGDCELLERCFRRFKNLADRRHAHALNVAQALGNIEDQTLGRMLSELKIARGPISFLDRYAALPIRKSGEADGDHQTSGETSGENVSTPRGGFSALADVGPRLVRWRRGCTRLPCDPAFRLLQSG